MKFGRAAGPSGVVGKMLIAGMYQKNADIINSIIRHEKVPKDWEESYTINA